MIWKYTSALLLLVLATVFQESSVPVAGLSLTKMFKRLTSFRMPSLKRASLFAVDDDVVYFSKTFGNKWYLVKVVGVNKDGTYHIKGSGIEKDKALPESIRRPTPTEARFEREQLEEKREQAVEALLVSMQEKLDIAKSQIARMEHDHKKHQQEQEKMTNELAALTAKL